MFHVHNSPTADKTGTSCDENAQEMVLIQRELEGMAPCEHMKPYHLVTWGSLQKRKIV